MVLKTLIAVGTDNQLIALGVRGDHELNTIKAEKISDIASPFQLAEAEDIKKQLKK